MSIGYSTQKDLINSSPLRRWSQMTSYATRPAPPITNPTIGFTATNTTTNTSIYKYGNASALFTTAGTGYLLNSSGSFNWWPSGTGDFTIQWWQYIPTSVTGGWMELSSNEETGGLGFRLGPGYGSASFQGLNIFARGQADLNYSTNTWVRDTWQFVSICRNTATIYIHVDGVSQSLSGSGGGARNFTATSAVNKFQLGGILGSGLRGVYIDDYNVFQSTALYTSATYTPPTSQAILTTGTTLLLNMNGTNGGTSFPNVTSN
jgi:hypothetical protein